MLFPYFFMLNNLLGSPTAKQLKCIRDPESGLVQVRASIIDVLRNVCWGIVSKFHFQGAVVIAKAKKKVRRGGEIFSVTLTESNE